MCLALMADHLSRPIQPITNEWSLHTEIVNRIFGTWGTPTVDMFATFQNTHFPQFMPPILEPRALAIDALSQDWQGRSMYMFPPFPLLNKVIQKLRTTQEGEVNPIAPRWPFQSLFPHLLRLCVDHPRIIPYRWDLLSQQDYASDGKSYRLHAWRLSCSTTKQQDFPRRSLDSWQPSTNRMYDRRQVASLLSRTGNAAAVQAKTISDMLTSMNLQRPRMTTPWDLGIMLEALSKPPYEPLQEASLKHLTLKTVFLLGPSYGFSGKMQ